MTTGCYGSNSKSMVMIRLNDARTSNAGKMNLSECFTTGLHAGVILHDSSKAAAATRVGAGEKRIRATFLADGGRWSVARVNLYLVAERQDVIEE
jgi:hypothetical protein